MAAIGRLSFVTELNISDTEVTSLAKLADLRRLSHLNCNGCKITNDKLQVLALLPALTELHVDCPNLNDAAMPVLASLSKLQVLHMFETRISDNGVDHLTPLAGTLHELELCGGLLTNEALTKLNTFTKLRRLNLSQNPHIDDRGVAQLTALKQLTHVNFSGCTLTHRCIPSLQRMQSLRSVSLYGCKITLPPNRMREGKQVWLGVDADRTVM